jgi:DNA-binding XRE family transcriptional regulator
MQHVVDTFYTPAYSVRADLPDLPIDAWNHAAERELGRTADEVIGRPAYEVLRPTVEPSERERHVENLQRWEWWSGWTTLAGVDGPITFRGMCWPIIRHGAQHYLTVLRFFPQFATIPHNGAFHETRGGSWQGPMLVQGSNPMTATDPVTEMIGVNIRRVRREQKISQEKLAIMLGKHRQHVSAWENARIHPNSNNLQRIADTLKVPVGELFKPLNGK